MREMQLKIDELYGEKIIPENDSVRMLEKTVSEMDLSCLYATYSNKGRPPATSAEGLLTVMLYACMEGKYSSREIETACKRDINYIWLLNGEEVPNYHEICRFRSERLSLCAEELFYQLVKKLQIIEEIKYDAGLDEYICQNGKKLKAIYEGIRKSSPALRVQSHTTNVRAARVALAKRSVQEPKATEKCRCLRNL